MFEGDLEYSNLPKDQIPMTDRHVQAGGSIDRSVVVTGDGNRVSLAFGDAFRLPLDRRQCPPPPRRQHGADVPPDLLSLLAPDAGKLPLVGREALLDELQRWLESDVDVSVKTLIARAGSGKTRLAVELCRLVDGGAEPAKHGWIAGFIRPSELEAAAERLITTNWTWPHRALLVIDYAAAVHRPLGDWLDRLASEQFDGKLRLLLLEREAPESFGWWHELSRPTALQAATRRDLLADPDSPGVLPDLEQGQLRHDLLIATQAAAQALIGDAANRTPFAAYGSDEKLDAALAAPQFGNPLNLAMAGIIAAQRGPNEALGLRRLDAARHLARHEVRRIELIAKGAGVPAEAARHALGFNNLCGGLALETINADLERELAKAGLGSPTRKLADLLQQELPSPKVEPGQVANLRLGTTQPDLVGEGVVIETLLSGSPAQIAAAPKLVERAYALTGSRAAEALMRLIQDFGYALEDPGANEAEKRTGGVILGLFTALADAIPDDQIEALEILIWAMPDQSLVLREAAAAQTVRLAKLWAAIAEKTGDEAALDCAAGWQNNLANRLSDLGLREAAYAAAQKSVEIRRALAAAQPAAFASALALSLNNLANRLSDVGQHEQALDAAQQAVDLRRVLAKASPGAFKPSLAMSLNNLAIMLSKLGRRDPALTSAQEAVDIYRGLAAVRPDTFTPELASSLNTLAIRLGNLGQHELALGAAKEAVDLRRQLASEQPDAFTPSLATALNNFANRQAELGQFLPALTSVKEAVEIWRVLAFARPDVFRPDLASSLNNLAGMFRGLDKREEALDAGKEATDLYRALFVERPDVFAPNLAGTLGNLSVMLSDLDKHELALATIQEAVELYRVLAVTQPDVSSLDLARSLSLLGDLFEYNARIFDAVAADREAVSILSSHFFSHPEVFSSAITTYLRDYIRRAELAGIEVDSGLVMPIHEKLKSLQSGDPE